MRKRIYEIIEPEREHDFCGTAYNVIMQVAVIVSILPLAFRGINKFFIVTNLVTTVIFIIDYLLRWVTADYKMTEKGFLAFVIYPFTPWAIVDLVSILPGLSLINGSFKLLRIFRLIRSFRLLKIFKAFRYSKCMGIIMDVVKNSKDALIAVCTFAIGYILVSALIVFNLEPQTFDSFFEAVYWATVSLTTVGYGDIYPVTRVGRLVAMISSLFGIAVVALPSGIITAGYMAAITNEDKKEMEEKIEKDIEKDITEKTTKV